MVSAAQMACNISSVTDDLVHALPFGMWKFLILSIVLLAGFSSHSYGRNYDAEEKHIDLL